MYNYNFDFSPLWLDTKVGVDRVSAEDFWDELFSDWTSLLGSSNSSYKESFPPFNISSDDTGAYIEIGLAGWRKDELTVAINGKKIVVSGTATEKKDKKSTRSVKRRMTKDSFQRTYSVPDYYNPEKATAHYEDGLLRIFVPFKECEKETSRTLEIQ